MLLSNGHKFIFIKTVKTAGTSLEMCLSRYLQDPRDVITPIAPEDEKARHATGVRPRNFADAIGNFIFWSHMSAGLISKRLPPEIWDGYKKVTSERHPYEKAVSSAFFRMQTEGEGDFEHYVDAVIKQGAIRGGKSYRVKGNMVADVVIRYEQLLPDTNKFLSSLGLPEVTELPKAKTQYRSDKRPAQEILTAEQKARIYELCAWEFEYFGYEK